MSLSKYLEKHRKCVNLSQWMSLSLIILEGENKKYSILEMFLMRMSWKKKINLIGIFLIMRIRKKLRKIKKRKKRKIKSKFPKLIKMKKKRKNRKESQGFLPNIKKQEFKLKFLMLKKSKNQPKNS